MKGLNGKLSNSQLKNLKIEIKNDTKVTLNLSSNVVGDCNDEASFPHKFLLNNTQVWKMHKDFGSGLKANIKFSKTQLSKMVQLEGFFPLKFLLNSNKVIIDGIKKT